MLTHHKLVPSCAGAALLAIAAMGCSPEAGKPKGPPEGPFAVSDYFAASGAMGDGAYPPRLTINENKECKERPAGARGNCFSFFYDPKLMTTDPSNSPSTLWSGLYWQYPVNNWGEKPGLKMPAGLTKVTFQAAVGEGESEMVDFAAGGVGYVDPNAPPPEEPPAGPDYPHDDTFKAPLRVGLNGTWTKLEITLPAGAAIDELIGAFTWSLNYPMGADPATLAPKTLYVDDIYYE
jgi:hypothetical protein